MENRRANFLINKSDMEKEDKDFLLKHLSISNDFEASLIREVNILKGEISKLRDEIDYGEHINDSLLSCKERIIGVLETSTDQELSKNLIDLLAYINQLK